MLLAGLLPALGSKHQEIQKMRSDSRRLHWPFTLQSRTFTHIRAHTHTHTWWPHRLPFRQTTTKCRQREEQKRTLGVGGKRTSIRMDRILLASGGAFKFRRHGQNEEYKEEVEDTDHCQNIQLISRRKLTNRMTEES